MRNACKFSVSNLIRTRFPFSSTRKDFTRRAGPGKEVNYLYADGHIKKLLEMQGTEINRFSSKRAKQFS